MEDTVSHTLSTEVTSHHFCCILFDGSKSLGGITSSGAMSEAAYIFLMTIRGILCLYPWPHFIILNSGSHGVIPELAASFGNLSLQILRPDSDLLNQKL